MALALNADFIGLEASDVQLATAVLVVLTLVGQRSGGGLRRRLARGALGSVGMDYVAIGRISGHMVADILDGKPVSEVPPVIAYEVLTEFPVVVNLDAAAKMNVSLPQSVLDRAESVVPAAN